MQKPLGNQPESVDNKRDGIGAETPTSPLTTDAVEARDDMADSHSIAGRAPAFQFYPKDFLSDLNVVCMSMAERGCYITLICACWTEGSLPSNPDRLARLCGMSQASFQKFWPALEPCFRVERRHPDRLVHPRLEREREKQAEFRGERSDAGKRGAEKRWKKITKPSSENGSAMPELMAKHSSSPATSDLQSASSDSSQKSIPALIADARSKRPIFTGTRFVVFEWQLDDLRRMLGPAVEAFDLHDWFFKLSAKADEAGLVVPQRDGGKWLQEQTLAEAERRGLAVATVQQGTGKTAGNLAAAARFVARGAK